jgi:hypothetical protein
MEVRTSTVPVRRAARRTLAGSIVALLIALTGCGSPPSADQPSLHSASSTDSTALPDRTAGVGCANARQEPAVPPTDDDLIVGPLEYPGVANGYRTPDGRPLEPDTHGQTYYKIGAEVATPAAEVTVGIGDGARDYAAIITENGREGGYSEVTYSSCDDLPAGAMNWWVGGFVLTGRESGCIPLEITTSNGSEIERVDLALPSGACD